MEQRLRWRPREGRGLYRQPRFVQHRRRHVAVPARGAGCIGVVRKKNNFITLLPSPWGARAASTAIPQYLPKGTEVAVPVGGRRLHLEMIPWSAIQTGRTLPSPRGVRVASSLCSMTSTSTTTSCRPREGCGLHQQKDTNPYQHICRFHTTRRLSITQGQQKMQGVLCLLYRKRECNLIVGSANRLFLRDKNAREKQRLAGNC